MTAKKAQFRVGCSGYQYDHWKGILYPEDAPKKKWFSYYCREFDTVEVNNTFYNLPNKETFAHWAEEAPKGFLYTLKFSRYGTHLKRLKDPEQYVSMFLEHATPLGSQIGPILVQLPPHWHANRERLAGFLATAPAEYRWAVEFRDPDWLQEPIYEVLREHNAALVIHDLIEDHPEEITADWVYLRFHGAQHGGDYPHQALSASARRIKKWLSDGLDVYAYFNNDMEGFAVHNAQDLRRFVAGE